VLPPILQPYPTAQGKVKCVNPASGPLSDSPITVWLPDVTQLACTRHDPNAAAARSPTAYQRTPWPADAPAPTQQSHQAQSSSSLHPTHQQQPGSGSVAGAPIPEGDEADEVVTGPGVLLIRRDGADGQAKIIVYEGLSGARRSSATAAAAAAAVASAGDEGEEVAADQQQQQSSSHQVAGARQPAALIIGDGPSAGSEPAGREHKGTTAEAGGTTPPAKTERVSLAFTSGFYG